jgi:hypothetical protein
MLPYSTGAASWSASGGIVNRFVSGLPCERR